MNNDFVYVIRKEDPKDVIAFLRKTKLSILYSQDSSGLSHFLKKVRLDLLEEDPSSHSTYCFYIDCESKDSLPSQIAKQILRGNQQDQLILQKAVKNKRVKGIIKTILQTLSLSLGTGAVKVRVNAGDLLTKLIWGIENTLTVDLAHAGDYKLESAIEKMLDNVLLQQPKSKIYYLFDRAESLNIDDFTKLLIKHETSYTLLAFSNNISRENKAKKLTAISTKSQKISWILEHPDDDFILRLFNVYKNESSVDHLLSTIKIQGRNIHNIMGLIHGHIDILDNNLIEIFKFFIILGRPISETTNMVPISEELLFEIFTQYRLTVNKVDETQFHIKIKTLLQMKRIIKNPNAELYINHKITVDPITISPLEEVQIPQYILQIFEKHKRFLNIAQLKFVIRQYGKTKNLSAIKSYVLTLLDTEEKEACSNRVTREYQVEQEYLDLVHNFSGLDELLKICVAYYNQNNYDAPFDRMKSKDNIHLRDENPRAYDIMLALLRERKHDGNHAETLRELAITSNSLDEKCLLTAILFVAYLNSGIFYDNMGYKEILECQDSELFYKNFESSVFYHYLLRGGPRMGIQKSANSLFTHRGEIVYERISDAQIACISAHFLTINSSVISDSILKDVDLSNADLIGSKFISVSFENANLSHTDISTIWASKCTFTNVTFDGTSIIDSTFIDCNFIDCNFRGITLTESIFDHCSFNRFEYDDSSITLNVFSGCTISNALFKGSFLYQIMDQCTFDNTKFEPVVFTSNYGFSKDIIDATITPTQLDDLRNKLLSQGSLISNAILSINIDNELYDMALGLCVIAIIKMIERDILVKNDEISFIRTLFERFSRKGELAPITVMYAYKELRKAISDSPKTIAFEKAINSIRHFINTLYFMTLPFYESIQTNVKQYAISGLEIDITVVYNTRPTVALIDILNTLNVENRISSKEPIFVGSKQGSFIELLKMTDSYLPYFQAFCTIVGLVIPFVIYSKGNKDAKKNAATPSAEIDMPVNPNEESKSLRIATSPLTLSLTMPQTDAETEKIVGAVVNVIENEKIISSADFNGYHRTNIVTVEITYS